jgi:SAM-dependent methyltransferase
MLVKDNIRKIYAETLLGKAPVLSPEDIQMKYIRSFLPEEKHTTILDAGCGNGKYAFKLAEYGYENIYAVDLFENIRTDQFIYQQASIDNLSFDESFFDFLYCNSVIFYLPNPEKGIVEFKRVLKKGGIVFITAHSKYSLFTLWRCIKRLAGLNSVQHLRGVKFYTAKQYSIWLERNGFEILLIDGYNLSFFVYPLYRKFARACDKIFHIKLPVLKNGVTRSELMARLKSVFGYHSIIVARKK